MSYSNITLLIFSILFFSITACRKTDPPEPALTYLSISKGFMAQNGQDSLLLTFSFTDGDGDIGNDTEDNIFVTDSRTNQLIASYRIPEVDENSSKNGRQGDITLILYSQCCIYPDSSSCYASTVFPTDSMSYKIQVKDKAGNLSNIISTDAVQLDCE